MGGFRIYQDNYADFTIVSNHFIDEYMEDANDAQLKIYLYLIRMLNADLPTGINDIADKFNYTEKDVLRALKYWEKKHVISLEYDSAKNLVGICMLPIGARSGSATVVPHPTLRALETSTVAAEATDVQAVNLQGSRNYEKPTYSKEDLRMFKSRESSAQLVFVAEQYLKKTLTPTELGTILYLSDTLHFSDDLIDYLLQYCVGHNKTDHRYIEKVALDWAESGVTTPKEAASHSGQHDKIIYEVMRALGKQANPTNIEISFINKWTRSYSYDMDIIGAACERTVLNTDRNRFTYADSILTRWFELGVKKKDDIDILDTAKRNKPSGNGNNAGSAASRNNKFNQFPQNRYDYASLEEELISN